MVNYTRISERPRYSFETGSEKPLKDWETSLLPLFKQSPLKKYHYRDEAVSNKTPEGIAHVSYYLDIFKITELPDDIDKAAERIVEGLKYLEKAYGNMAKN